MNSTQQGANVDASQRKQIRQEVIEMCGKLIGLSIDIGYRKSVHGGYTANELLWQEDVDLFDLTNLRDFEYVDLKDGKAQLDLYIYYHDRDWGSQLWGNLEIRYEDGEWTAQTR